MSTIRRGYNKARNPFLWPPGFTTYYRIGVLTQRRLPTFESWQQIARRLGVSKQSAYTEGVVALGKFLYRLVRVVGEVPEL